MDQSIANVFPYTLLGPPSWVHLELTNALLEDFTFSLECTDGLTHFRHLPTEVEEITECLLTIVVTPVSPSSACAESLTSSCMAGLQDYICLTHLKRDGSSSKSSQPDRTSTVLISQPETSQLFTDGQLSLVPPSGKEARSTQYSHNMHCSYKQCAFVMPCGITPEWVVLVLWSN